MEFFDKLTLLSLDLKRSSSSKADELWSLVDKQTWEQTRNPWLILQTLSKERKEELSQDTAFLQMLDIHIARREESLSCKTWFGDRSLSVAYFSMEFGLSEALPIYSGGLGILAGDHLKASADLGVPVIGVGILWGQGYFRQDISADGEQQEFFPYNNPMQLPAKPLDLIFCLDLPGRKVWVRTWEVCVGRVKLFLMDTNDLRNAPVDRAITSELYGGDTEMRIKQEVVLGIGGWKMLRLLGYDPDVCHLNEGHAAFAIIARAHELQEKHDIDFETALLMQRSTTLFTTHTPVAAGFDWFSDDLLERFVPGISHLGKTKPDDMFNMAVLALRGSFAINGVSKLHGEVSKKLFADLFPGWKEIPVGYVTNGVHVPSWESIEADELWSCACGCERWRGTMSEVEREFTQISDDELWEFRLKSRAKLIEYVKGRCQGQSAVSGFKECYSRLDPNRLTLGFARRFASYKRVDLLLSDPERLVKILDKCQLIIAGKAHPQDKEGKAFIKKWNDFLRREDVAGRVVFLNDYDILLAERMVHGVDVWINTPRRPWEASGTSGMKLLANGGLNCSELDGWWAEAYTPDVGWAIGDRAEHPKEWDKKEATALYELLENEIVPLFQDKAAWLKKVRESMSQLTMKYSTNRMVREYTEHFYLPLCAAKRSSEDAKRIKSWIENVEMISFEKSSHDHTVELHLRVGSLGPLDLQCVCTLDEQEHELEAHIQEGDLLVYSMLLPDKRPQTAIFSVIPKKEGVSIPLETQKIIHEEINLREIYGEESA